MTTPCLHPPIDTRRRRICVRRLRRRVYGFLALVAIGVTIFYGQNWLLGEARVTGAESALSDGIAHAFDATFGVN